MQRGKKNEDVPKANVGASFFMGMKNNKRSKIAKLVLEDGKEFEGVSFGATGERG